VDDVGDSSQDDLADDEVDAVRDAVDQVVASLEGLDEDTRRKIPDTTVAVLVRDLDVAFFGRLTDGRMGEVTEIDPLDLASARLRITLDADTLIDLVEGRLHFGKAWAKGRIKVDARFRDLLELRRFL
jgi:hypothetical protein